MQRTVAIDNIRRSAALTHRLTGRRRVPSGVIDWREFTSRRTSPAFGTRWSTSPLAASGSRFAVSRATPPRDDLELFAAGPRREAYGEEAPRPRVRRETADDHADRPSTAVAPASPSVPAPQFRISRRSAGVADATRPAPRPAAPPAPPTPPATPARGARAQGQGVAPPARHTRANTSGDLVLRMSPSKTPDSADATAGRDPALNVLSRPGPHTPAAAAPHSRGNVAAPETGQFHALSRKAANPPAGGLAPPRSPIGRTHSRVSIARKHLPKVSAFPPRDTPLRRKTRPGGRAGMTTLSGETPHRVSNVAHAGPDGNAAAGTAASQSADGAYGTHGNFVAAPPPAVETLAEPNVIGVGLRHRPPTIPTILRRALPPAPVRRVEARPRAEAPSAGEILMRKVAPARAAEPAEARPLVMRQAASTTSGTPVASPASPEAAAPSPAPAAAAQSPEIDLAQLAEQVSRIISRRLAVERERRGQWK